MQIGIFGLMFAILFGLKMAGLISISWWLVTLPLYGPVVVGVAALAFSYFVYKSIKGK